MVCLRRGRTNLGRWQPSSRPLISRARRSPSSSAGRFVRCTARERSAPALASAPPRARTKDTHVFLDGILVRAGWADPLVNRVLRNLVLLDLPDGEQVGAVRTAGQGSAKERSSCWRRMLTRSLLRAVGRGRTQKRKVRRSLHGLRCLADFAIVGLFPSSCSCQTRLVSRGNCQVRPSAVPEASEGALPPRSTSSERLVRWIVRSSVLARQRQTC